MLLLFSIAVIFNPVGQLVLAYKLNWAKVWLNFITSLSYIWVHFLQDEVVYKTEYRSRSQKSCFYVWRLFAWNNIGSNIKLAKIYFCDSAFYCLDSFMLITINITITLVIVITMFISEYLWVMVKKSIFQSITTIGSSLFQRCLV